MRPGRTTRRRGCATGEAEAGLVVYGVNPVLELLRSTHPCTRLLLGRGPRQHELERAADERGVPVEAVERTTLERMARSPHHQGAVALSPTFSYAPLDRLTAPGCPSVLALDGVQDPRNLGAILRTARAFGVGGILLPRDRSAGVTGAVVATAAGMLFDRPVARVPNLVQALERLKEHGFWLLALVPHGGAALPEHSVPERAVLVAGGEGDGLRPLVRSTCDFAVSIPMQPGVESLNVGVAVGIALYELIGRRGQP